MVVRTANEILSSRERYVGASWQDKSKVSMQFSYLGHAGFVVETEDAIVIMDLWLSPAGAFDASWFQLPGFCDPGEVE